VRGIASPRSRLVSKIEALDKLCRHLGMYEDKPRIMGLERELQDMSDEEIDRELIELERGDYRRVDASAGWIGCRRCASTIYRMKGKA
jgi:hypothetical protein